MGEVRRTIARYTLVQWPLRGAKDVQEHPQLLGVEQSQQLYLRLKNVRRAVAYASR